MTLDKLSLEAFTSTMTPVVKYDGVTETLAKPIQTGFQAGKHVKINKHINIKTKPSTMSINPGLESSRLPSHTPKIIPSSNFLK